jgi:hypothetical protein
MGGFLPPDMGAATSAVDDFSGATYAAAASSVFSSTAAWCRPGQGVSFLPRATSWISQAGTYDPATGYPTAWAASTTVQAPDGTTLDVAGEWLELCCVPGAFADRFLMGASSSSSVPDDFVLLASPTDPYGSGGASWRIVSEAGATTAQGAALVQAGIASDASIAGSAAGGGRFFRIHDSQERFAAFRVVVTRVLISAGFVTIADLAQIDVFKLTGSIFAPVPNLLFTVDTSSLVVDRSGHVGIGRADRCTSARSTTSSRSRRSTARPPSCCSTAPAAIRCQMRARLASEAGRCQPPRWSTSSKARRPTTLSTPAPTKSCASRGPDGSASTSRTPRTRSTSRGPSACPPTRSSAET